MAKSPVVIPFSTDGVEIPLKDGVTLPTDARGFLSVGLDGTTARFVVVDSSGRQVFVGAGVAGTPAGGVVSVQGVAGGTAIPISAASLPLPAGAATETTLASRLADATFTARINTLGQKTMANSTPVVIASDQSSVPVSFSQPDVVASGTIAANNVSITTTDQGGVGSFSIQITGTWVGTIQFEASVDGTNYVNVNARTTNSGTVGVSTTVNGVFRVARPGYQFFRCRSSAWTSGTATVTIRQASGASATIMVEALPTGANVIGAVKGSGNFNVVGPGAAGAAISGNPVRIGLSDGTNTRNILGDASGRVIVVGAAADGAAVAGNPVLMAGQDGTNAQSILTDTTGRQVVVGAAAAGAAVTGNPVLMGGSDGTNAQNIRVASDGTVRIDPTGTTTQPISGTVTVNQGNQGSHAQRWMVGLSDGTAFIAPATDRTTAAAPFSVRLSDGTAFYDGTKTGQLPSALVGGRLDANVGSWLGSTAPTVGQKTMAASIPIVIASDQGAVPVSGTVTANIGTTNGLALDATLTGGTQKAIVRGGAKGTTTAADVTSQNVDANTQALHVYIAGGGGSGGTASNFGAAFPSQGTAGGFFDGTNMQGARVFDADSGAGSQFVLGAILRKSASGGSVEAGTSTDPLRTDPTGTTAQPVTDNGGSLTVDGTVTANQGGTWTVQQGTPPWSVVGAAADGAAPSGNPVLIAGQDGTNVQTLKTDTTGRQEVIGGAANGVAVAGNPVRIGGSDGTLTRDILTDVGGRQVVVGGAADGAAPVGNPVLMAGQDGTNTQSLLTDTSGRPRVVGAAADGAAIAGDPVLIAGQDGTNVQSIRTLTDGTVQVRYKELATFTALATATVVGNNKSMLSIVNASGSTVQVRVLSIHVVNVQTTAVTGVAGTFEIRRCVNHSAGTAITAIEKMDSTDALNGSVTVRTNGTITTESTNLLWRALFSTDEWGPGAQDVESGDHVFQTMFPIWKRRDMDAKPILLRANEGLTVKFATNSTAGSFDILVIFTQE